MKKNKKDNPEVLKLISIVGLSQKQLAEQLGVAPARISEYKTGKTAITVQTLKSWCKKLNINIKDLF